MIPVVIIRPQPGCDASLAAAGELGLYALGFPLFDVRPVPWEPPEPESIDALLIGSANALRHAGAALSAFRGKPAYVVGEVSAEAARAAELDVVATGEGGLQAVLELVQTRHRRLLRLTGETRVELAAPEGIAITECVVYRSTPRPMPQELVQLLSQPALVLAHSAEAARHFTGQCDVHGIDRSMLRLAAMAPRVAEAAGSGWGELATAEKPSDEALLALARQMCQDASGSQQVENQNSRQAAMQDGASNQQFATARPPRTVRTILIVALLAFVFGVALAAWLDWRGAIDFAETGKAESEMAAARLAGETGPETGASEGAPSRLDTLGSVETRLALLEDRLSRLNLEASAASGNVARAEGLLIAFAARRMTDKGARLGYLEDQLKLRFANAQPHAVDTVINFAKDPVTLEEISGRLDVLKPELAGTPNNASTWSWIKQEFASLFVVRRAATPSMDAEERIGRARLMLSAGKIEEAIAEVERLPGAESAQDWIADAHRYAAVQRALDVIETTAMLEPRRLQDAEGKKVDQPSPLAQPANAVKPEN